MPVPEDKPPAGPGAHDTAPMQTPIGAAADETIVSRPVAPPPPSSPAVPPPPPPPPAGPPAGPLVAPPSPTGPSLVMLLAVFGLALAGVVLLGAGIYAVMRLTAPSSVAVVTATPSRLPTQGAVIPTTTPQPTATDTATPEPTATTAPPSATATLAGTEATEAAEATVSPTGGAEVVTIVSGANVRGGPGTDYPVIGGIAEGDTAPVIGISAGGTWYAIDFGSALEGRAWVSAQVATYAGNDSDLPIIAAPPRPAATATPRPSNNPAPGPVTGVHGVSGQLTMCGGRLTFAVNERVCFVEMIKNNTAAPISYGVLGVQAVNTTAGGSKFQTSWDAQGAASGFLWIDPGCTGPTDRCNGVWEDGMRLPSAGSWRLTMQVCFSDFTTCLNGGDWESLSAPIIVTIN